MTIGTIKVGDIVEVDHLGTRFFAIVKEKKRRELVTRPIIARFNGEVRIVKPREVIGLWRRSKQTRTTGEES